MNRSEEIFAEASLIEPEKREAFLADACGEDADLRLEVQRMLVDSERAESHFCDRTTGNPTFGDQLAGGEKEGEQVGPYVLRQELGEGGFGVVWMAEQSEPIQRKVALKVIKPGMDTRQVLARFEAERQALAIMDHPNIAKVLDAGATSTGRPYFAMELVKGVPITQFCDEQKYGPRQRLELFLDVCSAVNHAHQKGVIHRDLKPSNVMVTLVADKPVAKVIDFGIAKATESKLTDKTLFTRHEQFLGTPVYTSPEQAALRGVDIDTRSDIYSLGVLLYELLSGTPPFDRESLLSAGYDEMRRIIREDEPPKPSTRLRSTGSQQTQLQLTESTLKGDLDWIVMKALEKDRTRRYETANAFAADIGRYLGNEPVEAAAPDRFYLLRKFVQRNRAAIAIASSFVLLLIIGTAVSTNLALQESRARKETEESLAREEAARIEADQAREEEEKARIEAEQIAHFMGRVLSSPSPDLDGRKVTVLENLDRAVKGLRRKSMNPEHASRLRRQLGNCYIGLGIPRKGVELLEENLAFLDANPDLPKSIRMDTYHHLAVGYDNLGEYDRAVETTTKALEMARDLRAPYSEEILGLRANLGMQNHRAGNHEEGIAILEELLPIMRTMLPPTHEYRHTVTGALGDFYCGAGRQEEGVRLLEEAIALPGGGVGSRAALINNLAISHYKPSGRIHEAIEILESLEPSLVEEFGESYRGTLITRFNLSGSYLSAGRPADHYATLCRVLQLQLESEPGHPLAKTAAKGLAATAYNGFSNPGEVLPLLEAAARNFPDEFMIRFQLGRILLGLDRPQESLEHLRAAAKLPADKPDHWQHLQVVLAQVLEEVGLPWEAAGIRESWHQQEDIPRSFQEAVIWYDTRRERTRGRVDAIEFKFDEASAHFENVMSSASHAVLGPDYFKYGSILAVGAEGPGHQQLAIRALERFGDRMPHSLVAWFTILACLGDADDPSHENARRHFAALVDSTLIECPECRSLTVLFLARAMAAHRTGSVLQQVEDWMEEALAAARSEKRIDLQVIGLAFRALLRFENGITDQAKADLAAAAALYRKLDMRPGRSSRIYESIPDSPGKMVQYNDIYNGLVAHAALTEAMKRIQGSNASRELRLLRAEIDEDEEPVEEPLPPETNQREHEADDSIEVLETKTRNLIESQKWQEAIAFLEPLLEARLGKLGPEDSLTISTASSLADCYGRLGRSTQVVQLLGNGGFLARMEKESEFPPSRLFLARWHLANAYSKFSQYRESLPLWQDLLHYAKENSPPRSPMTRNLMHSLGVTHYKLGQPEKAIPVYEELVAMNEEEFGTEDYETLYVKANLGTNYRVAGEFEKALLLLEEVVQAGKQYPELANWELDLFGVYRELKQPAKSAAMLEKIISRHRGRFPAGSQELAGQLANLSFLLLQANCFEEAEPIAREALEIRGKVLPDGWSTHHSRSMLGGALLGQGNFQDAEPLLLKGLEGLERQKDTIPAAGRAQLKEAIERLVSFYEKRGRAGDAKSAEHYRQKLANYRKQAAPEKAARDKN